MKAAALILLLVPVAFSLDCSGVADIVVAVPGSPEAVPSAEFASIETFLHGLVSYFNIGASRFGLVLYGREPVTITNLEDATTVPSLNGRVTLLTERQLYGHQIAGGQNVPKAIKAVHDILKSGRAGVPKIGLVMTFGNTDLTSSSSSVVMQAVSSAAAEALDDGIHIFATSTNGTVPGFENITRDRCRLFSLGSYDDLSSSLLPYLASAMCYVLNDDIEVDPKKCFPELLPPPTLQRYRCKGSDLNSYLPDPYNCAYMFFCPYGRIKCAPGSWFEPLINRCTALNFARCYNKMACPRRYGLFAHPDNCNKFISCAEFVPHVQECQPGFRFYAPISLCVPDGRNECADV